MTVMAFYPLEQFWLEQRVDQIDEKSRGHERSERVVKEHDPISSELFAGEDISDRHGEEADRERHHHDVHHWSAPIVSLRDASRYLRARGQADLHQDSANSFRPFTGEYLRFNT
jgi:hypothetical protein